MKAALYARVSTLDKHQDPEVQLREMREYCARMGWQYSEYIDHASGIKESRPEYRRLMQDADLRKIDLVLVWSLDRFGRSLRQLVNDLDFLGSKGIDFRSHTQSLDTTTPQGKLLFHLLAVFAEFERGMTSERVKAGLASAKAKGVRIGRPSALERSGITVDDIRSFARQGLSIRQIAMKLHLGRTVVHEALRGHEPYAVDKECP